MHKLFSLQGHAALVTRAGSEHGIGFATARLLAEMGARVANAATSTRIFARTATRRAEGHAAHGFPADLIDRGATRAMLAQVEMELGPISIHQPVSLSAQVKRMQAQEFDEADRDQVEGDDVVEQPGHHEDQDACEYRDEGGEPEMKVQETSFVVNTASMRQASTGPDGIR
jgi:NAD(P)-dependent dehydrogenase (short-subunit alcohol dehydrogenase family)